MVESTLQGERKTKGARNMETTGKKSGMMSGIDRASSYGWWRLLLLGGSLLLSITCYSILRVTAQSEAIVNTPFLVTWLICFVPYLAACAYVLATKEPTGRLFWIEMGIIFAGALSLRLMLLPLPPNLSRDAWRYLWDARVTLHGYSPYVYAPWDKVLEPLRDPLIYGNSHFHSVPTIYPPGAQFVYIFSYLVAPSNLVVLKSIFTGFDLGTCVLVAMLLKQKGLDPRWAIIYAWCPLPIVEFAMQGHVDVLTLPCMVLAMLCAGSSKPGMRACTGGLIGLATLTKIYPIFLLVVVLQRRDWGLLSTCFVTLLLGYLPFLILGHGQALGFFLTYVGEQSRDGGIVQQWLSWLGGKLNLSLSALLMLERTVDVIIMGTVALIVFMLRQDKLISMEAATILLIAATLAISSHVYPWYVTSLLPWVVVLIGPLWTRQGLSSKSLLVATTWYFSCMSMLSYFFTATVDWHIYYLLLYAIVLGGIGIAALGAVWRWRLSLMLFFR